ncbi:MAG: hypothetical protein WAV13_09875 [Thermodesulfovibrionales bacterium]
MKRMLFCVLLVSFTVAGCGSMLPSARQTSISPWDSFDDAKKAFDKIALYQTTEEEMRALGFDPFTTPNIKILTYVHIMNRFMPNPSIKKEELAEGIRSCIDAKENCVAYEFDPEVMKSKRYGSVMLDLFNFQRKSNETGWKFEALVVIVDNIVVYKLWGGNPMIRLNRESNNPLGPLQNSEDILREAVMPNL